MGGYVLTDHGNDHSLRHGWLERVPGTRALRVTTRDGARLRGLRDEFALNLTSHRRGV